MELDGKKKKEEQEILGCVNYFLLIGPHCPMAMPQQWQ